MPRESTLAQTLVTLADTLVADFDVVDLLTTVADSCVTLLDVGAAGIMLAAPEGGLRVMASSNEAMRLLELFELQSEEGPCLEAFRDHRPVLNQQLATAGARWPRFAPEAVASGFKSVQALPMRLRDTTIGVLNLFHMSELVMTDADVNAAQALADMATIAILQHRAARDAQVLTDQLSHALGARIVIEQAKGMIAEREQLTMQRAFELLRTHARRNNLRLADLAAAVIDGSMPAAALTTRPTGH